MIIAARTGVVFGALLVLLRFTNVCSQSCYSGIGDLNDYPLPSPEEARYFLSSTSANEDIQVIAPQLRFNCTGHITGWSAHTLVLTEENFLETLAHRVKFQVWRPNMDNSYSLVGSNELLFSGTSLRSGITVIPDRNDTAFFSLNATVPTNEQIYFISGDILGWTIPARFGTINPPLSLLFRDPLPTDPAHVVTSIGHGVIDEDVCTLCNVREEFQVDASIVPLVSAEVVILSQDETSCSDTCNVVTTPTPTTNAMSTETETDATSTTQTTPTSSLQAANCTTLGSVTVAESVCIAIATITLLFNIITIILCAVNLFVMKQIKEALPKAAAPKTPTTFNLGSPTRNAAFTPSLKTPASYGKAHHSSDVKETLPTKHQDPTDNLELQDTPITMRRDLVNLGPQNTPPIMHRDPMSSSRDNLITTIN